MNAGPRPVNDAKPVAGPALDISTYERLIDDGTAEADRRGGPVDHVTARRLAIWLAARPQQQNLTQGLLHFIRTGAITKDLGAELRKRARSDHPHRPQAARLVDYAISRQRDLGPLGPGFANACDQIDRADAMLAERRDRIRHASKQPSKPSPDATPRLVVQASRDSHTVSLTLDAATANLAITAIAAHAGDREAHARDVYQYSHALPEGSYGRANREAIGAREMDAATRLRAIERAYHLAISYDPSIPADPVAAARPPDRAPGREPELE